MNDLEIAKQYFNNLNIDINSFIKKRDLVIGDFIDIEFPPYKLENQYLLNFVNDKIMIDVIPFMIEKEYYTLEELQIYEKLQTEGNYLDKSRCSLNKEYEKYLINDCLLDAYYIFTNDYNPENYYNEMLNLQNVYNKKGELGLF
jgi:hypothetical protein